MPRSATSAVRISTALAAGAALLALPSVARAVDLPRSINAPPQGAGTEQMIGPGQAAGYRPGIEASASLGTGFSETYGLGVGGRVGYTFQDGIYAGGAAQYYAGHSVADQQAHATFIGAEIGYKLYPTTQLEVRPYAFAGPAFVTQVSTNPVAINSQTTIALQPGVVAQYHFGNAFLGADAHYMVTPAPNAIAVMADAGFGF
jgi:hypothetical protein